MVLHGYIVVILLRLHISFDIETLLLLANVCQAYNKLVLLHGHIAKSTETYCYIRVLCGLCDLQRLLSNSLGHNSLSLLHIIHTCYFCKKRSIFPINIPLQPSLQSLLLYVYVFFSITHLYTKYSYCSNIRFTAIADVVSLVFRK